MPHDDIPGITDPETFRRVALGLKRRTLSALQAGKNLGCSRSMIYKLAEQGELDAYKVGRSLIVYEDSLEAFKRRQAVKKGPRAHQAAERPQRPPGRQKRHLPPKPFRHLG